MSNIKFTLNKSGVRELLRSSEMMEICQEYANAVAHRAGTGYEVSTHTGRNRVNASVTAGTFEAKQDNLKNNTLLKAVR